MFNFKPSITNLSSAAIICLFTGPVSADSIYSTYHYLFTPQGNPIIGALSGTDMLNKDADEWVAGYFFVNPIKCSNGCDVSGADLQLDGGQYSPVEPSSLSGVKLEIFTNISSSSTNIGKDLGQSIFQFNSPTSVTFNGNFGTKIHFSADAQDQNTPALLQPNTGYWLKLTNVDQSPDFGWFYNGLPKNEYWLAHYDTQGGEGSPYIFDVLGANSATPRLAPAIVPLPGAVWMMGSALMGALAVSRRNKQDKFKSAELGQ
ncbi:VPLPA-CTERM sorting domain-containing protein [Methylomonas sp. SURF-1]|uniref:VPLPA-CTERM sorting domain-containing protein n=1 Tax=Methylomonas aurea TaxID=2952224 RepID=A0ABT1UF28_9GAMM|nr:VPLPA-CTERM sorting domain-containing protein [Methylomonas sp. SURF-1]MCQ8180832.1 VPLPA-CTERM sorting domain-containing protein [Methylomonas sp. SURF-1]